MQSVASVFAVQLRVVNIHDKDAIERGMTKILHSKHPPAHHGVSTSKR